MKNYKYGYDRPAPTFLERITEMIINMPEHTAKRIGAALCTLSAVLVIGGMILAFYLLCPAAIEQSQEHSHNIVAESRGVAE